MDNEQESEKKMIYVRPVLLNLNGGAAEGNGSFICESGTSASENCSGGAAPGVGTCSTGADAMDCGAGSSAN